MKLGKLKEYILMVLEDTLKNCEFLNEKQRREIRNKFRKTMGKDLKNANRKTKTQD